MKTPPSQRSGSQDDDEDNVYVNSSVVVDGEKTVKFKTNTALDIFPVTLGGALGQVKLTYCQEK